jgi:hypothetical protein
MELTTEFYRALTVSWLCFAAGAGIFHAYKTCQYGKVLSRLLLALSPGILSAYGFHSVQVRNTILAAKSQRENVSGRVYLTSIERADCGDGYAVTVERYSNGTANYSGQMPDAEGRTAGSNARLQDGDEKTRGMSGRILSVPAWREFAGHWDRHKERDL